MLTDPQRALLEHPERWQLVASSLDLPRSPTPPAERRRWYRRYRWAHSHAELVFGLEGETVYGLGDAFYPIGPGTVIAFAPMEPHQNGYPPFESDLEHLWISLMPNHFTARVVRMRQGRMTAMAVGPEVYEWNDPRRLLDSPPDHPARSPDAWRAFRLRRLAMDLILTILEHEIPFSEKADTGAGQGRLVLSIQQHLQKTAGRGDSLDSLSRIAGYSRFHFLRMFRREAGCTVHAYVDRCRRRRVHERMAEGWSQKAIAVELGFATPQSFSRWHRAQVRKGSRL